MSYLNGLHFTNCSSMKPFHRVKSFRNILLWWSSQGCRILVHWGPSQTATCFRALFICCSMGSSMDCRWKSVLLWLSMASGGTAASLRPSPQAAEECTLQQLEQLLPLLLHWPQGLLKSFSHIFYPLYLSCCSATPFILSRMCYDRDSINITDQQVSVGAV